MNGFSRHLTEMVLSMVIPFSVFFVVVQLVLPSVGISPSFFFLFPVAIVVMTVPMTTLMLYRRHSRRDIAEMNAAMFAGMLAVLPAARFALPTVGISFGLEVMFPLALVAMTAPMVVLMYARRERYVHHRQSGHNHG